MSVVTTLCNERFIRVGIQKDWEKVIIFKLFFYNKNIYTLTLIWTYFVIQFFTDDQPLPLRALDYVKNVWVTYFVNYYYSRIDNE